MKFYAVTCWNHISEIPYTVGTTLQQYTRNIYESLAQNTIIKNKCIYLGIVDVEHT